MGIKFTEKEILATEAGKISENVARIQAKGEERQKKRRPHEPAEKMTGLEKSFLYYWRLCGGNSEDWLFGQHIFADRPRMHVDFYNPHKCIAVEIDGGQWQKGGHTSGTGVQRDAIKLRMCNQMGVTLYRLTTSMVSYEEIMNLYEVIRECKKDVQP